MRPPIAYDLTRLFIAPIQRTPRGIDRHDVGLAKHFFETWPGDCVGTLPTPTGVRCVSRDAALRLLKSAVSNWGEATDPDGEVLFGRVKERLMVGRRAGMIPTRARYPRPVHIAFAVTKMLKHVGCAFGPLAVLKVPLGAVYLNTGQVGIAIPQFLSWLNVRSDVKPIFMLHDTIPLEYAEYVPPNSPKFHQNMIDNAARYAAGLIVTTLAAQAAICRELQRCGRSEIPVFAEHAPVPAIFAQGGELDRELAGVPYFVIAGAIEPRKNHLLLLNVWRRKPLAPA